MSLAVINLPTNKTESTVSDHVRKIGQGEKGLTLEVIVMDADSSGYDLTNKVITFSENKVGGKIVVDSAKENFERLNDTAGRFRYKLADAVYAASGEAWFSISTPSGDVIDTTKSFNIDVIEDATIHINNDNYVSTLTALETHYKSIIQRTEDDNAALLSKFNQEFQNAVDTGNSNIQKVIDSANQLISSFKTELGNEQQTLTGLQNDWQTQTKKINADYESQKKAIQKDADSQLADNKKAVDGAIATIESDKQAAIDQANTDFKTKLESIQTDYNSWKTTTIADFQKQLDQLKQELKDDEDAQSSIRDAIKVANNAISKINDVDFTKFAHLSDLENYYDKPTMDEKLAETGKLKQISINGGTPVEPDDKGVAHLTISEPDLSSYQTKVDAKADVANLSSEINKRPLTVNNIAPDDKGNIALVIPDLSTLQKDVDTALNRITALENREIYHYSSSLSDAKTYSANNPQVLVGSK